MNFHGWHLPDDDTHFSYKILESIQDCGHADYQWRHRQLAISAVRNFRTAIDVGAHIGFWSKQLCEIFEKVVCFEPDLNVQKFLEMNCPKAEIFHFALGRDFGSGELFLDKNQSGVSFISNARKGGPQIEIRPLDSFEFSDIDFIKFDIEGYEFEALMGSLNSIKKCRPVICIEQKSSKNIYRKDFGIDQYRCIKFLEENLDYKVFGKEIDDWVLIPN